MRIGHALSFYLLILHLALAVLSAVLLWPDHRPWLLAVELLLLVSMAVGYRIMRLLDSPHELVEMGREWIREGDFQHSFRPRGTNDLKRLTELYNQMLLRLREERTRNEEQDIFLHKVLAASPSGVLTTDHDGRIDHLNPAAASLLGIAPDDLIGLRLKDASLPLLEALTEIPVGEARLLGQRGSSRLRCAHSSFFDRGFPRSFYLIDDLTHELWESEKVAYETLIRTLSHEVNNTLGATSSLLHSTLAYGDRLHEDERGDFTAAVEAAVLRAQHLNEFMQRYAEVVRVPDPKRAPTDLATLLERILRLMEPECRQRRVDLALEVERGLPAVQLDVVQMEQVLVNIVRNANEAVEEEGSIVIHCRRDAGRIRLEIEDNGCGLSREALDNLFVPFYSTKPRGQGVGLTLAREILSRHHFDVLLDSKPGGPTRFVIVM